MKAVRIHQMGGPEVLTYEDVPEPTLGPGQVLLDVKAIGVNYNDVLIRKGEGSHNADELPITLGREASGIVLEVGEGVTDISVGELVAYRGVTGSYAERGGGAGPSMRARAGRVGAGDWSRSMQRRPDGPLPGLQHLPHKSWRPGYWSTREQGEPG